MDQFFLPVLVPAVGAISGTGIRLIVSETIYWNHVGREPISYPTSPYSRGTAPTSNEWVGLSAGLDDSEKRNLLILPRIEFRVVQPTAYHYSDHIIPSLSIDDTRKLSILDAKPWLYSPLTRKQEQPLLRICIRYPHKEDAQDENSDSPCIARLPLLTARLHG